MIARRTLALAAFAVPEGHGEGYRRTSGQAGPSASAAATARRRTIASRAPTRRPPGVLPHLR